MDAEGHEEWCCIGLSDSKLVHCHNQQALSRCRKEAV